MDHTYSLAQTHSTRIVFGSGVEARLPELVSPLGPDGVILVHDARVAAIAARLNRSLGARERIPVDAGEGCKTLDKAGTLAHTLRAAGATRGTLLVALGGGTVTDLVGFVASIFLRGVPLAVCPTTTLGAADAAIGGKNGVNHGGLKNELGTTRQPQLVAGDPSWFGNLTNSVFLEGFIEVVKKAAVLDAGAFARLEALAEALVRRDGGAVVEAIELGIDLKMRVVVEDEGDCGRRRFLNFGHTIGHAIESLAAGSIGHGACVSMGMLAECRAAGGEVSTDVIPQLTTLLTALRAPVVIPRALADPTELWRLAAKDKKSHGGSVPMVVPRELGRGAVFELTAAALERSLR